MRWACSALAIASALFLGSGAAQAQTWGYYGPSAYDYPSYGYGSGWTGWSTSADRWAARGVYAPYSSYYSSSYRYGNTYLPMRPPYNAGYREHYGYAPARRELKLYKPWLSRD